MNKKDTRLTPIKWRRERFLPLTTDTRWGQRFAYWLGKTLGGLEFRLKRIPTSQDIPWVPLRRPLAEATVALVTTGGVHPCTGKAFDLRSDASFRIIPRTALPDELCITHEHYDRRDAAADLNLIFPLERMLELEARGIVGRVAHDHYSFGFVEKPGYLLAPGHEVGVLLAQAHVDLAILVPAWPVCTRSVGLLGREIEACGVTTVALTLVRELAAPVKAPRMLFLHWPFGHALGEPHNRAQQETILHDVFSMARLAPRAGLVVDLPYQWRRQVYEPVTDWTNPSQAFTEGLARTLQVQEETRAE